MARNDTPLVTGRITERLMADNGDTMTRQVYRQLTRLKEAALRADGIGMTRDNKHRSKLDTQLRREKSGFYDGQTSVATALGVVGRLRRFKNDDGELARLV